MSTLMFCGYQNCSVNLMLGHDLLMSWSYLLMSARVTTIMYQIVVLVTEMDVTLFAGRRRMFDFITYLIMQVFVMSVYERLWS